MFFVFVGRIFPSCPLFLSLSSYNDSTIFHTFSFPFIGVSLFCYYNNQDIPSSSCLRSSFYVILPFPDVPPSFAELTFPPPLEIYPPTPIGTGHSNPWPYEHPLPSPPSIRSHKPSPPPKPNSWSLSRNSRKKFSL